MPNYFGLTEYIDRQIARYDNDIKHSSTRDEIHEFSGSRQALIDLKENLNEVDEISKQFICYLLSVLKSQFVTSYQDLNADNEKETYASIDIPMEEYESILQRLELLTK